MKNSLFMILHALCNSILPYFFYTWSINRIEVGKVSIITAGGEPSAAMMFGLIFFGEWPSLLWDGADDIRLIDPLCSGEKSSRCRVGSRAETAVRKCCKKNAQPLAI